MNSNTKHYCPNCTRTFISNMVIKGGFTTTGMYVVNLDNKPPTNHDIIVCPKCGILFIEPIEEK